MATQCYLYKSGPKGNTTTSKCNVALSMSNTLQTLMKNYLKFVFDHLSLVLLQLQRDRAHHK